MIASIGISFYLSAQSAGNYTTVANGNWNAATKWEIFDGSNWITAATYPGQNYGTAAVAIKIFHEIKRTALDGTASSDPEGTISGWLWKKNFGSCFFYY